MCSRSFVRRSRARKISLDAVDGIAVTCRPGLVGALLVGVQAAKGLAFGAEKPIVGVDHLLGHLLAVYLKRDAGDGAPPELPFVALLASGGHTAIYRVDGFSEGEVRQLGATRDDAAGEAFDKVSKLLGLGYPGGPAIDARAKRGDPETVALPLPMPSRASLEMSFSGLKTQMAAWVRHQATLDDRLIDGACASFQRTVTTVLARKLFAAAERERVLHVVLGGGVAANSELRRRVMEGAAKMGLTAHIPPLASCTDNAAMIAYAGSKRLLRGERDPWTLSATSATSLPRSTRKGGGKRSDPNPR